MKFELKAVDATNRVVAIELEASDEASAQDIARQRGYSVLVLTQRNLLRLSVPRLSGAFPTRLFSIELLALLEAGLNVVEALQALAEKESKSAHRVVLAGLLEALSRGEALSQAVAHFPQFFPPLYVATVRSSERTGDLKNALVRYIAYQEELDVVRRKAVSALLYPAILLVVGTLVLAFLIFYVVPRFARVYEDISTAVPLFSSLLLSLGRWVDAHAGTVATALVGALAGSLCILSKEHWRARIVAQLWQLPGFGHRVKVYQLARFYRTTAMLLRAGIPAVKALEMADGLLPANLRLHLLAALDSIREGRAISSSLTTAGLATPVATRMMAVGERSGLMAEMMERIARFYDDETARFVDTFTRVLEPALMAALGLAVGLVVVLMYMPIFELAGAIQ